MAKTLSQLRQHARTYLDEVSEADWKDAQINRELNYAYMEMYTAVIETYEDYYRKISIAGLLNGQQEYALPDDFFKLRRLEITYTSGGETRKASPYEFNQTIRAVSDSNVGSSSRPMYDLSGSFLRVVPVPTEDNSTGLNLTYIKEVEELTEDTDTIDIPFANRYAKYIVIGAVAQLMRKGQQEEGVALQYDRDFQVGIEKMKQELEDRYLDGVKMIQDTMGDWTDFSNVATSTIVNT